MKVENDNLVFEEQNEVVNLLKKLNISELGLYLTIQAHSEEYKDGVAKSLVLESEVDSKTKMKRVLNSLVKKGYVEVINDTIKIIK